LTLQQISTSSITTEIEKGLDFFINHFDQYRLFPRKIQTGKSNGKQIEVFSKQDVLFYFKQSSCLDCRINAFPSYTEYHGIQRYPPNLIFIDIDRSNFNDNENFEKALSKTLKNIKMKLNGGYPTVNNSGNGYHIIQPIECPILEQIEQFQRYKDKNNFFVSQEFLRFAENFLSNGKADSRHYPSFKSCQIRVSGSINSKYNRPVKIVQKWNGVRPSITREFLEDFRTYLEQKVTDQENYNINYNIRNKINSNSSNINSASGSCYYYYEWIDTKILAKPFPDCRKLVVDLILGPFLINIKKMSYEESYQIIKDWLEKCNNLKKLDNYQNFVNYRIHHALKIATQKGIKPMSLYRIKTDSRYKNTNLYVLILQNKK
jgi:hypothetical protein